MMTAIVLLQVEAGKVVQVAEALLCLDEVTVVYLVSGRLDLVAIAKVEDSDDLPKVVSSQLLQIDGILDSETLVAFRAHSRHDLEAMFSIGLE
jgi:DNA-binding Lrp family transcriptional regulator